MPTTVEALLVLVFFIAPGFIATLVKNRLVPFSTPSPFREAVESVVLSAFHSPVWVLLSPLVAEIRPSVTAFIAGTAAVPLRNAGLAFGIVVAVFLVTAPCLGALYALFLSSNVYPHLFARLAGALGVYTKTGGAPELWDGVFATKEQWWVSIRFRDGTGYFGLAGEISTSPSDRQILLVPSRVPTETPSLYRFSPQGELVEDLTLLPGTDKGVWIRVTDQVASIEVYR